MDASAWHNVDRVVLLCCEFCSGIECSIHADIYSGCIVSSDMPEDIYQPWGAAGWVWIKRILDFTAWVPAILDN